ncbi:DHH family phosphoesterase [Sulfuricurvum sp.]|uniref:DHH family phosphoesterase n=1 Tax=Sulfuricurvum sp. TaxID=2025608 RepID=UPI002E336E00|nr:DHH family phosphoesterase [Sulfuricurvum sp.]HEX5330533.1 DHH family phosphoesterase [Sulfuricurvum sp.]
MPLSLIDTSRHIVLIAHIDPDADSLGSACAFYSHLIRTHKKVTLFCASEHIDPNLAFIPWFEKFTHRFPEDADCMISFDCGSYARLGVDRALPLIVFDHHESNNGYGTHTIFNTDAISTTEVVYEYFVANGVKINGKIATALYAGLLDDSKCFRASECSAKTFAMAHALNELGADHALCCEWLFRRRSLSSLRVRGFLLKQMTLLADGRLALFEVPLSLSEESGASVAECTSVLDEALEMRCVQISLMIIERPNGGIKLSLRSEGLINAANMMTPLGGGGHAKRAGAVLREENQNKRVKDLITMITKELV